MKNGYLAGDRFPDDWPSVLCGNHSASNTPAKGAEIVISGLGWHTFRHTYRSLLDETGAPVGVQQKLMRHSNVSTTMNVYGNSRRMAKQEANSKVVQMVMRHGQQEAALQQIAG